MTRLRTWIAGLALLAAAAPAHALESAPVVSPRAAATLVSEVDAALPGQPFRVGLRLRMAPGWHTYWQNPGDAGVAPELSFTLPAGATAGPIAWPAPARQPEGPLMTYGYSGEVLLPVTISGGPGPVALHATWLVCEKICVPEEGDFRIDVPAGARSLSAEAPLFTAADARMPRPSPWQARIAPDGTLAVTGEGLSGATVQDAWFIPDGFGTIENSAPQTLTLRDNGLRLALKTGPDFRAGVPLDGLLVIRDRGGQDSTVQIAAAPGAVAATMPLLQVLGLALLGGLILNLMPCVFPVLAMKAVGLAALSGKERGHAWGHAAAYTAGVLACFAAIAFTLLALRQAGAVAGWGFQFQSPVFVAATAWVLFAVGLNLSGVFAMGGSVGVGQSLAVRGGHAGSFFTGLLAVLVATPCTAPFMGVAITAGLAGSPVDTLAVFVAMGLGLALPYVLLATIPAVARALPRPGPWMDILKQVLAFPMYAASAWLVWVVSQGAGPPGVMATAAGLVLIGFAGWALGLAQSGAGRRLSRGVAVVAGLAALGVLAGFAMAPSPEQQTQSAQDSEKFSAARLAALQAEGRPVFVNMTAAWCVTCLVNERIALAPESVRQAFATRGVTYLKGDWTRQDPEITRFLRAHDRDGVPLYMLFPGGNRPPIMLPQILTAGIVLDALDGIGG
ncbi:protein-disulfide reductase DsbD family protein [Limobrevibacterium gyesilva]|uniref:Protein-disulfide reductase DsbD family protein n=1 Tax=Limobrevibacterium gyesilva TaxID=2991712 RepID=A0AA42CFV3_9PROT|nr:protein-disulfide reductase DsbD domain-containing protein [Limobrevibacterium gyesilva]MCW3473387.1 protein-disulfide reductase DsbD family protein [Limobrevibacterium gyesilva]